MWWRLGQGPINLDMATPWLVSAIQGNLGHDNSVEIGGTQIERTGRIRIAVRITDIVVRDRDHAIVAVAPKAEVKLSPVAMLTGRLRAQSLNLVDAKLSIQVTPDGRVIVSAGDTAKPLATGTASSRRPPGGAVAPGTTVPAAGTAAPAAVPADSASGGLDTLLVGLEWLDSLSLSGLDGQNLDEIGLRNGSLSVDDQQRGNRWNLDHITLSLRRPSSGGVALRIGEAGGRPWSLGVTVGPQKDGVRSVEMKADRLSTRTVLLALRTRNMTFNADLPVTGELRGEIGRDGLPTFLQGRLVMEKGDIIDSDAPNYPMHIDGAEMNVEWDAGRRVLVAPFKIVSGDNRITLLAHLEPPNGNVQDWQLGLSGGTVVLAAQDKAEPLIFNRIDVKARLDIMGRRIMITQADVSNGQVGVAGNAVIEYADEPRLKLALAGTPMTATALKQMWPVLIVPDLRAWVVQRIERGNIQRIDLGLNAPVANLSPRGPPIPEDGMSINIVASGVSLHPMDEMPSIRDADFRARVTGRTAMVNIGQGVVDTPAGRRLAVSDAQFEIPDMAPKPMPAKIRFRVDGPVPAAAEILSSDRLKDFSAPIDPNTSKGTVSALVTLGLPIKGELTAADTTYSIAVDLGGFSADKLVMNQKVEANGIKVVASNQGIQVKGDVKIAGQPATIDYRKVSGDGDADIRLQATLDDASRARLGADLGPQVSGPIPFKLTGKIAGSGDRESRIGVEADLTPVRIDNILPGWVKMNGRGAKVTFNVVQKPQSTRIEDLVIEGSGATIKGVVEVDQDGDVINAAFPVYSPSEGDKANLKAERAPDGSYKIVVRGDVFDGRSFIKYAMSGKEPETRSRSKALDFDLDLKLGAVAGFNGEALRAFDAKMTRRNGTIRSLQMSGKLGRDTPVTSDLRGRGQGREVIMVETNDAGAFFRFTDTYSKMYGGQLQLAMDPPATDSSAKEGLLNIRDFTVRGENALSEVVANGPPGSRSGVQFTRMRVEFARQAGILKVREGVVKGPAIGATIEGSIDYNSNQVRMSGTFVPLYGLNNMFGQIPIVGLFLGGGSNEGLIGVTYEVVGTPSRPDMRVNPISAMAPGVLRKIFEFNTGRQNSATEFPAAPNN